MMISLDGFNDELSTYVTWYEYILIVRNSRINERKQI